MDSITLTNTVEETASCTSSQLIHFTHHWNIEHFSFYLKDNQPANDSTLLESLRFSPPTNDRIRVHLTLFPAGHYRSYSQSYISLYLNVDEMGDNEQLDMAMDFFIRDDRDVKHRIAGELIHGFDCGF